MRHFIHPQTSERASGCSALLCLMLVGCQGNSPASFVRVEDATCYFAGGSFDFRPALACKDFWWNRDTVLASLFFTTSAAPLPDIMLLPALTEPSPRAGLSARVEMHNGVLPLAATPVGTCRVDVERVRAIKTVDDAGTGRTSENGYFMVDGNYYVEGKGGCSEPLYGWDPGTRTFSDSAAVYELTSFIFGTFMKIE
jgi:hypothetical protein